jgi:hypothetical protein
MGLPNHLVRPRQHIRRNRQAELLGGLEIDHQLELDRLLDGKIGWLGSLRDFMCSCDNIHRPRDWRSFRSMACISGFGMVPTFRSIIVCLIVREDSCHQGREE